jgi:hypothetical protein
MPMRCLTSSLGAPEIECPWVSKQVYVGRPHRPQPKKVKRSESFLLDRPTQMLGQSGPTHWVGWVTQSAVRVCYCHSPTTIVAMAAPPPRRSPDSFMLRRSPPAPSISFVLQRCSLPQLAGRHLWQQSPSPALVSAGVRATLAEIRAGRRWVVSKS